MFSLDITPKAEWFIKDNIALGGYVNLGLQTAKGSSTTTSYGIDALGRYYTSKDVEVLKHGRLFGEATFGFGGVSDGGGNTNGINFSFGPGFAYFVTPSIGLETLLKYNGLGGFGDQIYQSSLNLSFGFQIYLPGKSTARKIKNDVNAQVKATIRPEQADDVQQEIATYIQNGLKNEAANQGGSGGLLSMLENGLSSGSLLPRPSRRQPLLLRALPLLRPLPRQPAVRFI